MKKMKWIALWLPVLLLVVGCASTAGFNKKYMPNAVPDQPGDKIMLMSEDNRVVSRYLSAKSMVNHIGLYWLEEDVIYLELVDSAIFGVDAKKKSAQELFGPEANEARKMIAEKVNVALDNEGRGIIRQFAASIFSYMGQKFTGDLTDNQQKISVEIKTYETRRTGDAGQCESAKLKGQLMNDKGQKIDVEWNYNCDWVPQSLAVKKVPQLLRAIQVSPSGKYYLFGSLLYNVSQNFLMEDLLENYSGVLSVSVNPSWTKMAVLRGKGQTYWVEIFDFETGDKGTPAVHRIDL